MIIIVMVCGHWTEGATGSAMVGHTAYCQHDAWQTVYAITEAPDKPDAEPQHQERRQP